MSQTVKLVIRPGNSSAESNAFVEILKRMYIHWAFRQGATALTLAPSEPCIIEAPDEQVRDKLRAEVGIHRLVRVSPFDTQSRRHTTFAVVSLDGDAGDDSGPLRSYVLDPYQRVTNHKTGRWTEEANRVLDGEIELVT